MRERQQQAGDILGVRHPLAAGVPLLEAALQAPGQLETGRVPPRPRMRVSPNGPRGPSGEPPPVNRAGAPMHAATVLAGDRRVGAALPTGGGRSPLRHAPGRSG